MKQCEMRVKDDCLEEEVIACFKVLGIQQFPGRYDKKDIRFQLVLQLGTKILYLPNKCQDA